MKRKLTTIKTIPFQGGCNTAVEPALLDGKPSMVQNFRQKHPGFVKRQGQIVQHPTTLGASAKILSMYQFVKGKKTERHFYAQVSDDKVYEAATAPPGVASTVFGSSVFSETASSLPASWANVNDFLLFCNGVDLPKIYPGTGLFVDNCYVYRGSFDPATLSNVYSGTDYSTEVSDGETTTYADVSSLGTLAETLGEELITNGAFDSDANWTKVGTAIINGGLLQLQASADAAHQAITVTPLEQYKCSFDITITHDAPSVRIAVGTASAITTYVSEAYTTAGAKSFYFTATSGTDIWLYNGGGGHADIDNLVIKKAGYHCIFVETPLPIQSLGFTISSVNGSAAVAAVKYWDGDSWANASTGFADTTLSSGRTLAVTGGTMSWTAPTDEKPLFLFSKCGYWYMIYLSSGSLDSETRISAISYTAGWQTIANMWDGVWVDIIEAQKYTSSTGAYTTYAAEAITLNSMASTDASYFSSYDDIDGIKVDVATPNATGDTLSLFRWNGTSWDTVTITDGTSGFSKAGRITFARGASVKQDFNSLGYMAHWYKLTTGSTLATSVLCALSVQPYYDITEIGKGQTVASWKNRAVYGTNQDHYVYLTSADSPQVLNGDESTILAPGDGRFNRPVAMRNFQDDLLIWQEEKGKEGGCLTRYSWVTSIDDIKKTIISTTLGTMNAKSVDIIDGVEFAELNRDAPIMSLAFFLSRSGVFVTDGSTVRMVSQDIQNYFDPTNAACIRVGYEAQHWLKYDSAYGVIRLGLVSGSSVAVPNVFPVYDVKDKSWSFDVLTQPLSCMTEAEAGSGAVTVVQLGGGTADGFVYVLNNGLNDVSTAINSFVTAEIDGSGEILHMNELALRAKVQSAGNITVTPSLNSIAETALTLSQTAETATQTIRRHRVSSNLTSQHISLKVQHNTLSESCQLLDMGVGLEVYEEQ